MRTRRILNSPCSARVAGGDEKNAAGTFIERCDRCQVADLDGRVGVDALQACLYNCDVMTSQRQITLRNPSEELLRRLKALAASRRESMNSTILRLLEQSVGVHERRERLSRYATWNPDDLESFERELRAQRTVDDDLWK